MCKGTHVVPARASPHFSLRVRNLNRHYPERWIGRGGPLSWPPRSPNLTSLDFYLWVYLKNVVYQTPVNNEENLWARVQDACRMIRRNPGVFEPLFRSARRTSCSSMCWKWWRKDILQIVRYNRL